MLVEATMIISKSSINSGSKSSNGNNSNYRSSTNNGNSSSSSSSRRLQRLMLPWLKNHIALIFVFNTCVSVPDSCIGGPCGRMAVLNKWQIPGSGFF